MLEYRYKCYRVVVIQLIDTIEKKITSIILLIEGGYALYNNTHMLLVGSCYVRCRDRNMSDLTIRCYLTSSEVVIGCRYVRFQAIGRLTSTNRVLMN